MARNKLTLEQVKKVFTEYKDLSGRKISKMYGVSHAVVNNIRAGRAWKNEMDWLKILEPQTFEHLSQPKTPKGDQSVKEQTHAEKNS